jgi:glycosyltransferase involved in cell wall biosynthesis
MRIAHIITRMILGGAQENTLLSCEDLRRIYGDDVLLITGPPLGPEGSLLDRARAGGLPLVIIPELRRAIHPWRDLISYYRIKQAIRDFQPEVVHTHSGKAGLLGRAAASALGVPAIVHGVHGAPFHPYQGRGAQMFFRACERWAASRCHAMVSVADAMTELMVNAGVAPQEKFTTIYSGMEVEPFLEASKHRDGVRRELGYEPEHVVVGKIARLFHLKGHEYLIRAARQVVAVQPNVRFLLVGDGLLAPSIQRQIADAGLTPYFHLTGLVPPQDIPRLISAMDIVVHTSLREGLARVLPQGLISGKPVVSYDVDGAREVVVTNQTGFLLPPQCVDELAQAIVQLANDPDLRARLGAEGQHRFTEVFRHQTMTRQLRSLYERLLASAQEARQSSQDRKVSKDGTNAIVGG